jgi:hypothetical protein
MNERIREIKESTCPEIDWEARHYVELNNGEKEKWMDEWFEKFAELIVRECGVALAPMLRDMVSRGQAFDLIKKHFGVEE